MFKQLNNGFSSICWSKRPGVHITILHWSIRFFSNFKSFPPIIRPAEISWYCPTFRSVSYIWYASSLVGVIIRAPRPSNLDHCLQYKISKTYNNNLSIIHHINYIHMWDWYDSYWNKESQCLAAASLCSSQNIIALQSQANALFLDVRQIDIVIFH